MPERRIDRPTATAAGFRKQIHTPGFSYFAPAPGTVTHETHELALAMTAMVVIGRPPGLDLGRRGETGTETPGAIRPLWQHPVMTAIADVAEVRRAVKAVTVTTAPGAAGHTFGDRFTAVFTGVTCM